MYKFEKNNRLTKYFEKYLKSFLFLELNEDICDKLEIDKEGRPLIVPVMPQDLKEFEERGLPINQLTLNMVFVIGGNPCFKHSETYIKLIKRLFHREVLDYIMSQAMLCVRNGDFERACVFFRAAVAIKGDFKEALYNYGRACKEIYDNSDVEDVIGNFKAEAIEIFEQLTIDFEDFAEGYYFLGYMYINMGLYTKAGLTWEKYLKLSDNGEGIAEIAGRLRDIREPREIELACNKVISGNYMDGYIQLLPFLNSDYNTWWPLHFYLAVACEELANDEEAEKRYLNALQLNPSFADAMDGLIRIYDKRGDYEMKMKYAEKKRIVMDNFNGA